MASATDELGQLIGQNIRDTRNLNQTMSHESGEDTYILFPINKIYPKEINLVITKKTIGNAFILGHADNGVLGTSDLGAGTYDFTGEEIVRRLWLWDNQTELDKGTTDNVTTENGDIRLP